MESRALTVYCHHSVPSLQLITGGEREEVNIVPLIVPSSTAHLNAHVGGTPIWIFHVLHETSNSFARSGWLRLHFQILLECEGRLSDFEKL